MFNINGLARLVMTAKMVPPEQNWSGLLMLMLHYALVVISYYKKMLYLIFTLAISYA